MEKPFRIETRESFRVLGYKVKTTNEKKEATKVIPTFWKHFYENNLAEGLLQHNNQEPRGVFGISVYNIEQDSKAFEYLIAVSSNHQSDEELYEYTVRACTWAVFPCTIETIAKTEVQAIMKWLPRSKYKPINSGYITGKMKTDAPDIQYYGKDGLVEVWVAVNEK